MERRGMSWSLSHSSNISTGWSVKKQMEVNNRLKRLHTVTCPDASTALSNNE